MIIVPCKDCDFRKPYCHSTCKAYIEFKKAKFEESQNMRQFYKSQSIIVEDVIRLKKRINKR